MKLLYPSLLLLVFAIFSACSKSKPSGSPKSYENITFGSGGGFAGLVKSYSINKEGVLKSDVGNKVLAELPSKMVKQIFKKISESNAFTTQFDQPGNFYYFIELEKEGKINRIVWHDQNKAPIKILELYQYLIEIAKPYLK